MTDLRELAAEYKRAAQIVWPDYGIRDWRYHGSEVLHRVILAVAELEDRVSALESELQQARARIDQLERDLIEARQGMYLGEPPF